MLEKKQERGSAQTMEVWPALPLSAWSDTCATLHMWTQIVGKIRLKQSPPANHWWQVTLYLTARGLTTSTIPYGHRTFQIDFDFIDHLLIVRTSEGETRSLPLAPQSVAAFYRSLMTQLARLGIQVKIWTMPVEVPDPIPFDEDEVHSSYDPESVQRFWKILVQTDHVFKEFSSRFVGKRSPVHFFWGSFDLAVTRFSGRRAPEHPGGNPLVADFVTREAYSHEVISCGFWPGSGVIQEPAFYAYAYPEPTGFKAAAVQPAQAFYSPDFAEFVLRYEDMRTADRPDEALLSFAQSTYAAGAELGGWNRSELDRS